MLPNHMYQVHYIAFALMAGSSHPSGPNLGITMSSLLRFLNGLENLHSVGRPSEASHVGFTTVKPDQKRQRSSYEIEPGLPFNHTLVVLTISWNTT